MLETGPEICLEAGKQGLITWLLKRIKVKAPFSPNKLYASEILAIMLQDSEENRLLLGEQDGIDVLLQQLAVRTLYQYFVMCFTNCVSEVHIKLLLLTFILVLQETRSTIRC